MSGEIPGDTLRDTWGLVAGRRNGDGSSRVTLRECLIGDNGAAQLRTEGHCHAELIDTVLLGNTAPQVDRQGGQVVVKRSDGAP